MYGPSRMGYVGRGWGPGRRGGYAPFPARLAWQRG